MAPRKTKTTVETQTGNAHVIETAEQQEAVVNDVATRKEITVNLGGLIDQHFADQRRFQVALAVFPTIVATIMPETERVGDENDAGACARVAFEYADAFIAYAKKGQVDGND